MFVFLDIVAVGTGISLKLEIAAVQEPGPNDTRNAASLAYAPIVFDKHQGTARWNAGNLVSQLLCLLSTTYDPSVTLLPF